MNDTPRPPAPTYDEELHAASVTKHLQASPDEYLLCREAGHQLGLDATVDCYKVRRYDLDPHVTDFVVVVRRCRCCTTQRVDIEDEQTGARYRRYYVHPDDYQHEGGRIPPGNARLEWRRRHPLNPRPLQAENPSGKG